MISALPLPTQSSAMPIDGMTAPGVADDSAAPAPGGFAALLSGAAAVSIIAPVPSPATPQSTGATQTPPVPLPGQMMAQEESVGVDAPGAETVPPVVAQAGALPIVQDSPQPARDAAPGETAPQGDTMQEDAAAPAAPVEGEPGTPPPEKAAQPTRQAETDAPEGDDKAEASAEGEATPPADATPAPASGQVVAQALILPHAPPPTALGGAQAVVRGKTADTGVTADTSVRASTESKRASSPTPAPSPRTGTTSACRTQGNATAAAESGARTRDDFAPLIDRETGATPQGAHSTVATPDGASLPDPAPKAPHIPTISAHPARIGSELGVELARRTHAGGDELTVRLDPAHHGEIEVRMQFDDAGQLRATVTASQPATLELLKRDSGALLQAINDAGIAADTASFQFDARSDNQQQGMSRQPQTRASASGREGNSPFADTGESAQPQMLAAGRLNLIA